MKCPTCGENTPDAWERLIVKFGAATRGSGPKPIHALPAPAHHAVRFDWMHCANPECTQLVIRAHDIRKHVDAEYPYETTETWLVHPRHEIRQVDPLVPESMRRDFLEAAAILEISHRMSAVLARRVLADLLRTYGGADEYGLKAQIDTFIADAGHPSSVRENLHYLREVADFGAHTQTGDQEEVIDASKEEAEWTLDVVERLFDYFIVAPKKDEKLRAGIEAKLKAAKRKPIQPLPSEKDGEETADRENPKGS